MNGSDVPYSLKVKQSVSQNKTQNHEKFKDETVYEANFVTRWSLVSFLFFFFYFEH